MVPMGSRIAVAIAFALPCTAYVATAAPCVGFDDAAELAWCAIHWGVAHPPGFPAWVALAHGATSLGAAFGDVIVALHVFVAVLGALACAFLQRACATFAARVVPAAGAAAHELAGLGAALAFGSGMVAWQWANAIEVYSLQSLASAALLWALLRAPTARCWTVAVGLALGTGLANHHATTLVLAPFAAVACAWHHGPGAVGTRRALTACGIGLATWAAFLGVLVIRAQGVHAFEFGNPDTIGRLLHHVGGGYYGEGLFRADADVAGRWLYLLQVSMRQYGVFLAVLAGGLLVVERRSRWLAATLLVPWLVTCWVQGGRTMVANMDSYLLPAFVLLALPVAAGLACVLPHRLARWLLPLALAAHAAWNLPACNRSHYDCGDALAAEIDHSAPPNSVLLLAGWEARMLYRLYRDTRGFRPDLTVLAADVKGTNAACIEVAEPGFLARIRGPYEAYLATLAAQDPGFVHTDWFTLSNDAQTRAYRAMVGAVIQAAREQGRPVLADRGAVAFLLQVQVVGNADVLPCGNLFSIGPVAGAPPFRRAGTWWQQPILLHDLCAAAVLRDQERTAEQVLRFFRAVQRNPDAEQLQPIHGAIVRDAKAYRADKPFLGWREGTPR